MTNDDRVKKLFTDALEIETPEERARFIAEACGTDRQLKDEVESLVTASEEGAAFLRSKITPLSAADLASQLLVSEEASAIGKLVGPYRIEKEIGHGGMGTVYLALRDDGTFQKRVAIKLLRKGTDNAAIVKRFETERQILADLEHPNIARLIDGGITETGLPYFVMEYVEGLPLDRYCAEADPPLAERLSIFQKVCSAVGSAHENAVIHRDIKPSNILVSSESVKLLDFGIAKLVGDKLSLTPTATALRAMTPEYASPEQIRGGLVGPASDIYSLGVVLYQLVSGRRPYDLDDKSMYEIVHAICEEDPVPPSDHLKRQNGSSNLKDLDNIVLKALNKEPKMRYASVRELSEDVSRHMCGSRVAARPRPLFNRMARSTKARTLAVLSFATLLIVTGITAWVAGPWQSTAESQEPASTPTVVSINEPPRGVPSERELGGSPDPQARELCRQAHEQWDQRNHDAFRRALKLYQQAIEIDPDFAMAYAGISNTYFLLSVWGGHAANDVFPLAREASLKAISLAPNASEGHLSLAIVRWLYEYDWRSADAEFRTAIRLNPRYVRALHWYGLHLAEMGRFDESIRSIQAGLAIEPRSLPLNAGLGRVLYYARRYDESLAQFRKTLALDPNNFSFYRGELQELYETLGMTAEWLAINAESSPEMVSAEFRKAFLTGGWKELSRKIIERDGTMRPLPWGRAYRMAEMHALLNENDNAFECITLAYEERNHRMAQLNVNPRFDNLRSDPRFAEWLQKLNLAK